MSRASIKDAQRAHLTRAAIHWSSASVGWAVIVGISSVAAGLATESLALLGLGANALLDGAASVVLIWRFREERSAAHRADAVERRAALTVGLIMVAIAVYLAVRAFVSLAGGSGPEHSTVGFVVAAGALLLLPLLAERKLRLAASLDSRALRADGFLSLAGAVLATATLVSLILNSAFGWWWSDSVAALLTAAMLIAEGSRTVSA